MPRTLLLRPCDILFFSDGRPMCGSLSGHTAAWPAPHIVNNALHAALHRSGIESHAHRPARFGKILSEDREKDGRKFGSLLTAGPFPVAPATAGAHWYFPAPADLVRTEKDAEDKSGKKVAPAIIGHKPVPLAPGASSLPPPLTHAPAATVPPAKDNKPGNWLRDDAFRDYLRTGEIPADPSDAQDARTFLRDTDIADIEHQTGIGIDAASQTQDAEHFYTAHYLRLRPDWRLGLHAGALDKHNGSHDDTHDLVDKLFPSGQHIIIGGQQRLCTVEREDCTSRLPRGLSAAGDFRSAAGKCHLKWVLLTPAIWPEITAIPATGDTPAITAHPGGWLPNWVDAKTGDVLLKTGDTGRRLRESREAWRARVRSEGQPIPARLVAALTGKPVPVTGWATGGRTGAKPVQFAVPAGSIYYFTCDTPEAARDLAAALNWHGAPPDSGAEPQDIKNRRSTLLGEKGYGLGLCGAW